MTAENSIYLSVVGVIVVDLPALQAAVDSCNAVHLNCGTLDLGGGTLTLPENACIHLRGGILTNGTIECDGALFFGARGLSSSIILTGTVANDFGVSFDWFTCEKSKLSDYAAFINGNNATYGPVPTISGANRAILKMLIDNEHAIQFGGGIYPFDAEIDITAGRAPYIQGTSRSKTLLWAPVSNLLHYTAGGAYYPYIRDVSIEADGNVIRTDAWSVNAIHGLVLETSFFISYSDHVFYNDRSTSGGTGCPIYGSKIQNCAVYAGPHKGGFCDWQSGSNVFDNLVDLHTFFDGSKPVSKGVMRAIFYNSNVHKLTNSNISYAGFDYVSYWDRPSSLVYFYAYDNIFETNGFAYKGIVKIDSESSNLYLGTARNRYIGGLSGAEKYHYVCKAGNTFVRETDSPTPLFGNRIRNVSKSQTINVVTDRIDVGATKYRLVQMEPQGVPSGPRHSVLLSPTAENAALIGMEEAYTEDSANISYIEVMPSSVVLKNRALCGGYGITTKRPNYLLYPGYPYFDTTLGHMVYYNGTQWVNGAGVVV